HGAVHRHHAAFPRLVKDRLVGLRLHLAEAVHAAHVVHAGHRAIGLCWSMIFAGNRYPLFGIMLYEAFCRAVPIIESRVTISARRSSLQPSVPAGRIGSTRNRVSAVESHTRISVSFGSVTPKSASTPRGSLTARERYGAALYQTGGRPSISH